jgi:S1-C subfamily serine protease
MSVTGNPLASTGMLIERETQTFLGSCAVYGSPRCALTAAHCIASFDPESINVVLPQWGIARVVAAHSHPKADLAVLRIEHEPGEFDSILDEVPFESVVPLRGVGTDFGAYGFPEHRDWGSDTSAATGRLFKGHFQRLFEHVDPAGYSYAAGEMSISSPRGLSGGPLWLLDDPDKLVGIAAANVYSETPGAIEGTVSYGVAVLLWLHQTWLDDFVRLSRRG